MQTPQTVFVTGGASGIGLAIAEAAIARGWRIVIADADAANLEAARGQFATQGSFAHFVQLNVTDEEAIRQAIARCEMEIGPLTGLVNSAGIGVEIPCLDTTTAMFRKLIEVNLVGSFVVARETARRMKERGRGSIVNIASVSGIRGNIGRVAYGASKAGVILMTQVMALELAPCGIRVNAIAPGPIETPLARGMHPPERRAEWVRLVPQHRYGEPKEIASTALFLLDDDQSSYISGQTICVDGGFTAVGLMGRDGMGD